MSADLFAQGKVSDYLNVPGPIEFEGKKYHLTWSSHPASNFYKQEYIQKGELVEHFNTMIMLDLVTESDIKNVVGAKVNELKKMKESNPVVNFEVIENAKTGVYILDFLVSANKADGTLGIVERNVYRYTSIEIEGQKAVLLFAVAKRAYDEAITDFFSSLKGHRMDLINLVAEYKIPEVSVKK